MLQSGITSGLGIYMKKIKTTHERDLFPNIEYIEYVRCPILIIHGN